MKNIRCGFALLAAVLCLAASSYAQDQKFADLGDFKLVSGETLRNCRIGYRTFGKMNADRSNIVVFPTWAGGTTEQLKDNVGAGKLINDADYYVILIDALANGVSSSPSNSASQPHMNFPKIAVRDMVNTQHELLTKALGIQRVKAVMSISMGGMQTFQWMVSYPDFMDKAIPIVGSPHVAPYDVVFWRINIDSIEDSAGWNHGDYTENPAKVVHFEIGELILQTPAEYNRTHTREQALAALKKAETDKAEDANDTIRQSEAMIGLDVSDAFGGSMEKAAAAVKVKVFVVVAKQDHTVTPQPARNFAELLHAPVLELESDCGHLATGCEGPKLAAAVSDFLRN
ncbi:MAG TPA: alpha/beta fold hydrolase [Candidatus Eremiobacteraceae bacterium]|nr:alpha/beta fold hydrolase [Candidatus Eremiobacteraceae bacterium]